MIAPESDQAKCWNSILPVLTILDEGPEPTVVEFLRAMRSKNVLLGLDIGCGSGRHTMTALQFGLGMVAVDFSIHAIEETKRNIAAGGFFADVHRAKMTSLPFCSNSFGFVVAWCVLNHGDRDSFYIGISEALRVVERGGSVLVCVMTKEDSRYGQGILYSDDCFVFTEGPEAGIVHYFPDEIELLSNLASLATITSKQKLIYAAEDIREYHPGAAYSCHLVMQLQKRFS